MLIIVVAVFIISSKTRMGPLHLLLFGKNIGTPLFNDLQTC